MFELPTPTPAVSIGGCTESVRGQWWRAAFCLQHASFVSRRKSALMPRCCASGAALRALHGRARQAAFHFFSTGFVCWTTSSVLLQTDAAPNKPSSSWRMLSSNSPRSSRRWGWFADLTARAWTARNLQAALRTAQRQRVENATLASTTRHSRRGPPKLRRPRLARPRVHMSALSMAPNAASLICSDTLKERRGQVEARRAEARAQTPSSPMYLRVVRNTPRRDQGRNAQRVAASTGVSELPAGYVAGCIKRASEVAALMPQRRHTCSRARGFAARIRR